MSCWADAERSLKTYRSDDIPLPVHVPAAAEVCRVPWAAPPVVVARRISAMITVCKGDRGVFTAYPTSLWTTSAVVVAWSLPATAALDVRYPRVPVTFSASLFARFQSRMPGSISPNFDWLTYEERHIEVGCQSVITRSDRLHRSLLEAFLAKV